jgi:hypothetical protein
MGHRRLIRWTAGWQVPELLMLAGGLLACPAALAGGQASAVRAIVPAGLAIALLGWRMQRLAAGRVLLRSFYASAAAVLGATIAGQAYLRLTMDGGGWDGHAWAWLAVASGLAAVLGGVGRLVAVTSAAGSPYTRSE